MIHLYLQLYNQAAPVAAAPKKAKAVDTAPVYLSELSPELNKVAGKTVAPAAVEKKEEGKDVLGLFTAFKVNIMSHDVVYIVLQSTIRCFKICINKPLINSHIAQLSLIVERD